MKNYLKNKYVIVISVTVVIVSLFSLFHANFFFSEDPVIYKQTNNKMLQASSQKTHLNDIEDLSHNEKQLTSIIDKNKDTSEIRETEVIEGDRQSVSFTEALLLKDDEEINNTEEIRPINLFTNDSSYSVFIAYSQGIVKSIVVFSNVKQNIFLAIKPNSEQSIFPKITRYEAFEEVSSKYTDAVFNADNSLYYIDTPISLYYKFTSLGDAFYLYDINSKKILSNKEAITSFKFSDSFNQKLYSKNEDNTLNINFLFANKYLSENELKETQEEVSKLNTRIKAGHIRLNDHFEIEGTAKLAPVDNKGVYSTELFDRGLEDTIESELQ